MKESLEISVLSAVQDHNCIESWIHAMENQTLDFSRFEVILVDGSGIQSLSKRAAKVINGLAPDLTFRYVPMQSCGRAKAMNRAVSMSRAPVLLFLADDFVAEPDVVKCHWDFHQRNPSHLVSGLGPGMFRRDKRSRFMEWLEDEGGLFGAKFNSPGFELPPNFWYLGNSSIKQELFNLTDGFDERFQYDAWDDYDFGLRLFELGVKVSYLPDALCIHEHSVGILERMRSVRNGGESSRIVEEKYPGPHSWQLLTAQRLNLLSPPEICRSVGLGLRQCLNPSLENREAFYRKVLDQAFAAGYRRAERLAECASRE